VIRVLLFCVFLYFNAYFACISTINRNTNTKNSAPLIRGDDLLCACRSISGRRSGGVVTRHRKSIFLADGRRHLARSRGPAHVVVSLRRCCRCLLSLRGRRLGATVPAVAVSVSRPFFAGTCRVPEAVEARNGCRQVLRVFGNGRRRR